MTSPRNHLCPHSPRSETLRGRTGCRADYHQSKDPPLPLLPTQRDSKREDRLPGWSVQGPTSALTLHPQVVLPPNPEVPAITRRWDHHFMCLFSRNKETFPRNHKPILSVNFSSSLNDQNFITCLCQKSHSHWEKMDTCMCRTESLCCPPDTITTLLICYPPTQNKVKKKTHTV